MGSTNKGSNARERHDGDEKSLDNRCATTGLESIQSKLEQITCLSGRDFLAKMKLIEFLMCLNILRNLHKDEVWRLIHEKDMKNQANFKNTRQLLTPGN